MKKVFIASPYTAGDLAVNVKTQIDMADKLMNLGYFPYTPLLSHFLHMANPRPYHNWTELDIVYLKICDCVLRLPGESPGADNEVKIANELGIPVYYSIEGLQNGV